jgi:hypothetical protein
MITLHSTPARARSTSASATSWAISPRHQAYVVRQTVFSASRMVSSMHGKIRSPLMSSSTSLPHEIGAEVSASAARMKPSPAGSSSSAPWSS